MGCRGFGDVAVEAYERGAKIGRFGSQFPPLGNGRTGCRIHTVAPGDIDDRTRIGTGRFSAYGTRGPGTEFREVRSQSADYYSGNTELPGRGVLFGQKQILDKEEFLSDGELILSRCYWADVVVWEADLIVGKWSDSTVTYLGYGSGIFPEAGSLDVTTFEYDGENYTIENLVLQQVTGGIEQLILNADKRLPNDFYFQVGDYLFAISDSLTVGLHQNIHAWREVESLDWQGGENVLVALIAELESGSQQRCGTISGS